MKPREGTEGPGVAMAVEWPKTPTVRPAKGIGRPQTTAIERPRHPTHPLSNNKAYGYASN